MPSPDINFFLHLGYFPDYAPRVALDLSSAPPEYEADLHKQAVDLFREAVAADFVSGSKKHGRHVVPLSGGLDSRAILCALMECTDAANIETYTFGTSGARDFEMGAEVAKVAGVKHRAIDLAAHKWRAEELLEIAGRQDAQTFLFHHVPLDIMNEYKDAHIWSGYIGDVVSGGHTPKNPAADLQSAKMKYLKGRAESNLYQGDLTDLTQLLGAIDCGASFDERVKLFEMGNVTAPHVLMDGLTYKTPFINNAFFDFFMGLPREHRLGRRLFIEAFTREYDLFALPSTVNVPLWRRAIGRFIHGGDSFARNYFDFNMKLRRDNNFAALIRAGLDDLKARDIVGGIDIDAIWNARRAKDIKILYSLEMNLKAKGIKSR